MKLSSFTPKSLSTLLTSLLALLALLTFAFSFFTSSSSADEDPSPQDSPPVERTLDLPPGASFPPGFDYEIRTQVAIQESPNGEIKGITGVSWSSTEAPKGLEVKVVSQPQMCMADGGCQSAYDASGVLESDPGAMPSVPLGPPIMTDPNTGQ